MDAQADFERKLEEVDRLQTAVARRQELLLSQQRQSEQDFAVLFDQRQKLQDDLTAARASLASVTEERARAAEDVRILTESVQRLEAQGTSSGQEAYAANELKKRAEEALRRAEVAFTEQTGTIAALRSQLTAQRKSDAELAEKLKLSDTQLKKAQNELLDLHKKLKDADDAAEEQDKVLTAALEAQAQAVVKVTEVQAELDRLNDREPPPAARADDGDAQMSEAPAEEEAAEAAAEGPAAAAEEPAAAPDDMQTDDEPAVVVPIATGPQLDPASLTEDARELIPVPASMGPTGSDADPVEDYYDESNGWWFQGRRWPRDLGANSTGPIGSQSSAFATVRWDDIRDLDDNALFAQAKRRADHAKLAQFERTPGIRPA